MIESVKDSSVYVDRDNSNRSPRASGDEDDDDGEVGGGNAIMNGRENGGGKLNKMTADVRRISGRAKVLESMESTQGDSLDSELDLDGDDDDDGSDLDSEDELELVNLTKKGSASKEENAKPVTGVLSDDDF